MGASPCSIFIDTKGTIYVPTYDSGRVLVWFQGNATTIAMNTFNGSLQYSTFVTVNGEIYVGSNIAGGRVDEWELNTPLSKPAMYIFQICRGLFVDSNNTLYCSISVAHVVVGKSLHDGTNTTVRIAGMGTPGIGADSLHEPQGIFVDLNFTLFVADCANHRIQRFWSGDTNGTTMAGSGAPSTINLTYPTGVILDADGYLFILDGGNNRIVASGPTGFRCIAGCSANSGAAMHELRSPQAFAFDTDGNIYVADTFNNRIQNFTLDIDSCGTYTLIFCPTFSD